MVRWDIMANKTKNYNGHLYIKGNLQEILNTSELNHVNSAISILFFPNNVSLQKAKESLKIIETNLNDMIKKEEEERINEENIQE